VRRRAVSDRIRDPELPSGETVPLAPPARPGDGALGPVAPARPSRVLPRRLRLPEAPLARHVVLGLGGAALLAVVSLLLSAYNDFQLAEVAADVMALAGLVVLTGDNGQISLGHGALMAVGAYTAALLITHTHLPLALELLAAVAAGAVFGLVVGVPASRMRGPYLAGMTLALAVGLPLLAVRFATVLGGEEGLSVPPPSPPGTLDAQRWLAWITLLATVLLLVLLGNLRRSHLGRAMRAVRDDEVAAALSGISVMRTQVVAFSVSAACAGLAGAFLGLSSGVVNPGEFPVALSVSLLAGLVLGGSSSLIGVWWGATLLVFLPGWTTSVSRHLGLTTSQEANVSLLLYGVLLVVVMLVAPEGIQGGLRRLWAFWWGRLAPVRDGQSPPPSPDTRPSRRPGPGAPGATAGSERGEAG
jgi:branched-chain amino acid transport system permease protein